MIYRQPASGLAGPCLTFEVKRRGGPGGESVSDTQAERSRMPGPARGMDPGLRLAAVQPGSGFGLRLSLAGSGSLPRTRSRISMNRRRDSGRRGLGTEATLSQ